MPTVRDIIADALRANGALGQDDSLSPDDYTVGLGIFRRWLGTLANQPLALYETRQGTMVLTPGTISYSSTLLSTGRPTLIDSAFLRLGGVDYPLDIVDNQSYDENQYKTNLGLPTQLYFDPGYPNSTFTFYFGPSAAYTAYITGRYELTTGTMTLDTDMAAPPGYEAMYVAGLAVKSAATFGRPVTQQMKEDEKESLAWLKRTNNVDLVMETNLPFQRARYNGLMGPI